MRIELLPSAEKDFSDLSPDIQERVTKKLDHYRSVSNPLVFAKRLRDDPEGTYRFEVAGDWRAKFDIASGVILIIRILHRSKAYPRKRR